MEIPHPELFKDGYFLETRKEEQIANLEFHKACICEEDQHVKPCLKPYICQML